jgi:hypothetical protein
MPAVLLTSQTCPGFKDRLNAIRSDTKPHWGKMDANQLMGHLRRSFEISLNEVEVEDMSNWFSRHVVKFLVFHFFTKWPKGLKAPDVFFPKTEEGFEKEKQSLFAAMQRFMDAVERDPNRMGLSPFVGPQPLEYWRRIHGVHLSHHLRQFGV